MTEEIKVATLKDVMNYFEEKSSKQFASEWKELTIEEKEWFKAVVDEVMFID